MKKLKTLLGANPANVRKPHTRPTNSWMSLQDLVTVSLEHESTPVAFDRRLIMVTYISIAVNIIAIAAYIFVSRISYIPSSGFFLLFDSQLNWGIEIIHHYLVFLIILNSLYLGVTLWLFIITRRFQQGRQEYHMIIFGQTILGSANTLVFSLTLAIVIINLVIWLLIGALVISIFFGMLSSS